MRGYKLNRDLIYDRMGELNWDNKALAEHSNMDIQTVYDILKSDQNVYLKTANKLANALNLKVSEIISK